MSYSDFPAVIIRPLATLGVSAAPGPNSACMATVGLAAATVRTSPFLLLQQGDVSTRSALR